MAGILNDVVIGFERIEPVIIANVALGKNFILIGRHGTSKTTLARILAQGYGGSYVIYDATKDDILSIAGIPKTKALEDGRFEFATGDRTVWGKQLIVIDELGRATKENQNILLEILQERTCFGQKLDYKVVIATMNPETYAASLRLDEALLDRFYSVIPVPDFTQGMNKETVRRILDLNFSKARRDAGKKFSGVYDELRSHYDAFLSTPATREAVLEYTSRFMELIKGKTKAYISNRKSIQTAEEIFAIGACMAYLKKKEPLSAGARLAVEYTISIPTGADLPVTLRCHNACKTILENYSLSEADLLCYEFARIPETSVERRIRFVLENVKDITKHLKEIDGTFMLGYVIDHAGRLQAKASTLQKLINVLKGVSGYTEAKRRAEGALMEELATRKKALAQSMDVQKVRSQEDVALAQRIDQLLNEKTPEQSKKMRELLMQDNFSELLAGGRILPLLKGLVTR